MTPTERAWFKPRPEAANPPSGRGMIDEQGQLHTWPSTLSPHEQMARDLGVQIASRLWIDPDGTVLVTGGPMEPEQAIELACQQDPRLRA